jgi:hypothetical protein
VAFETGKIRWVERDKGPPGHIPMLGHCGPIEQ